MIEFTCWKGTPQEGLYFNCHLINDEVNIVGIELYAFGNCESIRIDADSQMLIKMEHYCLKEYNAQQKYKALERDFMERLGETIIIEDERGYIQALWEFEHKTVDDNTMIDKNN